MAQRVLFWCPSCHKTVRLEGGSGEAPFCAARHPPVRMLPW